MTLPVSQENSHELPFLVVWDFSEAFSSHPPESSDDQIQDSWETFILGIRVALSFPGAREGAIGHPLGNTVRSHGGTKKFPGGKVHRGLGGRAKPKGGGPQGGPFEGAPKGGGKKPLVGVPPFVEIRA